MTAVARVVPVAAGADAISPSLHDLTTLPNGLRVASEQRADLRSVSVGIYVGVGARHEAPSDAGASHLLEHMLFRGSDRHDALELAQLFDGFGSEPNAGTTHELTEVHARVLDTHVETAFGAIARMIAAPSYGRPRSGAGGRARRDRNVRG